MDQDRLEVCLVEVFERTGGGLAAIKNINGKQKQKENKRDY